MKKENLIKELEQKCGLIVEIIKEPEVGEICICVGLTHTAIWRNWNHVPDVCLRINSERQYYVLGKTIKEIGRIMKNGE